MPILVRNQQPGPAVEQFSISDFALFAALRCGRHKVNQLLHAVPFILCV